MSIDPTETPPESAAEAVIEAAWDDARDDADLSALSAATRPLPPPRLDATRPADAAALVAMPDLTDRERADWLAAAAELDGEPAPLDLDAIEARANAATPGPWRAVWGSLIARGVEITEPGTYRAIQDVAEIPDDRCEWESDEAVEVSAEADAAFIAHARADVPALVAEVRRLERIIAETDSLAEVERDRAMAELADEQQATTAAVTRAEAAERDAEQTRAALAQCRQDLATARRDGAADALEWFAAEHPLCSGHHRAQLNAWATEVRAGVRTIPTTTEESDHDAH